MTTRHLNLGDFRETSYRVEANLFVSTLDFDIFEVGYVFLINDLNHSSKQGLYSIALGSGQFKIEDRQVFLHVAFRCGAR